MISVSIGLFIFPSQKPQSKFHPILFTRYLWPCMAWSLIAMRYVMGLCTSGFVDDVMSGAAEGNEKWGGVKERALMASASV